MTKDELIVKCDHIIRINAGSIDIAGIFLDRQSGDREYLEDEEPYYPNFCPNCGYEIKKENNE